MNKRSVHPLNVVDEAEKTLRAFALFHEVKSAVVARLFEGEARDRIDVDRLKLVGCCEVFG